MTQILQNVGHLCSQWFCKTKQWQSYLFHKGGYQLDLSTHDFPNQLLARLCKRDRDSFFFNRVASRAGIFKEDETQKVD